jgi:hypothetical protein
VGLTEMKAFGERLEISTVWLGIDHSFGDGGPPLIFETMIFGRDSDTGKTRYGDERYQMRYATEAGAVAGHAEAVGLAAQMIRDAKEEA